MGDMEYKNGSLCLNKLDINGYRYETVDDQENRYSIILDSSNKIISYRKNDGTLHEHFIDVDNISFNDNAKDSIKSIVLDTSKVRTWNLPKYGSINFKEETFYLTSYTGVSSIDDVYPIQILEDSDENAAAGLTIYRYFVKSSVKDNGDGTYSQYNDGDPNHDISLDFWPYGEVEKDNESGKYYVKSITRVGDLLYYTDTLIAEEQGGVIVYRANGRESAVVNISLPLEDQESAVKVIEVTQITGDPCVGAWAVNKCDKHMMVVNVDFGKYFSGKNYCDVKFQGKSTLFYRRRNFRITFYKKSDYKKKNKIKIGELLRLSGYNLKSAWKDPSRLRELFTYRLIMAVYQSRDMYDRYPWYKKHTPLCGATGTINGFNIRLNISGKYYGTYYFGLKKDERNYMLDGDNPLSGAFIQAEGRYSDVFWTDYHTEEWGDEMNDEKPIEVDNAMIDFYDFINNRQYKDSSSGEKYKDTDLTFFVDNTPYTSDDITVNDDNEVVLASDNDILITSIYVTSSLQDGQIVESSIEVSLVAFDKDNIPERMSILDWIDYFILVNVFVVSDNVVNNVILYSDSNMKKWYTYFYDLDFAIPTYTIDTDPFIVDYGGGILADVSIWNKIKKLYWDEIVNRYSELRSGVLSFSYLEELLKTCDNVPQSDRLLEKEKWGNNITIGIRDVGETLKLRLNWLDNNYFI